MTKDVLISISGLQFAEENDTDGAVEMITSGEYFLRNEKHYLIYNEAIEGSMDSIRNMIKIAPDYMELTKKGPTTTHMIFQKDKKNVTYYYTPYGSLLIGIDAHKVDIQESEQNIHVDVEYALEVNYEHVADCKIDMNVKSKDARDFKIVS